MVAPRLPPHTSRQAHPRSTSLLRKDTTPSPPTTPNPRAHPPPTTRPSILRAFPRHPASTRDNMATRASNRNNNTRRMANTGKYQARPPARRRPSTASPNTGRDMATSRRPQHTESTSKVGTMGRRRHTLRLQDNTSPRQGMAARTVACHMGHITTEAIPRTRRTGDSVMKKARRQPWVCWMTCPRIFRLAVRTIEPGLSRATFPRANICSRQGSWGRDREALRVRKGDVIEQTDYTMSEERAVVVRQSLVSNWL